MPIGFVLVPVRIPHTGWYRGGVRSHTDEYKTSAGDYLEAALDVTELNEIIVLCSLQVLPDCAHSVMHPRSGRDLHLLSTRSHRLCRDSGTGMREVLRTMPAFVYVVPAGAYVANQFAFIL